MNKISKDRALAALVRTFFKYFLTGIMEGKDIHDPKAVKQTLLEHYEHVAQVYNREAFYAIARMNYEAAEIENAIRQQPATDLMQLVRIACRTEPFYQTMVEEYKRHFLLLLEGRLATSEEAAQYTPCPEAVSSTSPLPSTSLTAWPKMPTAKPGKYAPQTASHEPYIIR